MPVMYDDGSDGALWASDDGGSLDLAAPAPKARSPNQDAGKGQLTTFVDLDKLLKGPIDEVYRNNSPGDAEFLVAHMKASLAGLRPSIESFEEYVHLLVLPPSACFFFVFSPFVGTLRWPLQECELRGLLCRFTPPPVAFCAQVQPEARGREPAAGRGGGGPRRASAQPRHCGPAWALRGRRRRRRRRKRRR